MSEPALHFERNGKPYCNNQTLHSWEIRTTKAWGHVNCNSCKRLHSIDKEKKKKEIPYHLKDINFPDWGENDN